MRLLIFCLSLLAPALFCNRLQADEAPPPDYFSMRHERALRAVCSARKIPLAILYQSQAHAEIICPKKYADEVAEIRLAQKVSAIVTGHGGAPEISDQRAVIAGLSIAVGFIVSGLVLARRGCKSRGAWLLGIALVAGLGIAVPLALYVWGNSQSTGRASLESPNSSVRITLLDDGDQVACVLPETLRPLERRRVGPPPSRDKIKDKI